MLALLLTTGIIGEGTVTPTPSFGLDLESVKKHLRVTSTAEDSLVQFYLDAAISWIESYTGSLLTRQQVEQEELAFCTPIGLQYRPDPDTFSVAYTDYNNTAQTFTDVTEVRGRLYPDDSWPTAKANRPILITYTAGFAAVPQELQHAVFLLVGHWFDEREMGDIPIGVLNLIANHRVF